MYVETKVYIFLSHRGRWWKDENLPLLSNSWKKKNISKSSKVELKRENIYFFCSIKDGDMHAMVDTFVTRCSNVVYYLPQNGIFIRGYFEFFNYHYHYHHLHVYHFSSCPPYCKLRKKQWIFTTVRCCFHIELVRDYPYVMFSLIYIIFQYSPQLAHAYRINYLLR